MEKYSLSCADMGVNCQFVAKSETKEEVIKMTKDHAMKAHPMEMKEMAKKHSEEEMKKMMEEKVKTI